MSTDSEFAQIIHNDFVSKATDDMRNNELTVNFDDDTSITMTELEWFRFVGDVADTFKWSMQVMTWHDLNHIISEHVGWQDSSSEETRRREFFEEGIATSEIWRNPAEAWSPIQLVASLLSEAGYFETPEEMMKWAVSTLTAHNEFMSALADKDDDDREVDE